MVVWLQRDTESGGSMMGSAVAFRLFMFFVPLLLLVVGLAGLAGSHVDPDQLGRTASVSGGLGDQMRSAFEQSGRAAWTIAALGLVGVVTTGRSLSRVLLAASSNAWRIPIERKAPFRIVGAVAGLAFGMGLVAILVNRTRVDLGVAAAGLSLVPAFAIYGVAWLIISLLLPRGTEDPGAALPGALLMAAVLTAMHAVSELYLPDQFSRASELYGSIGATIVTLGWFFIVGRSIVIALELNPVIYERYGSVSTFVFSLPVLRLLPRRSERLRRFFDLNQASDSDGVASVDDDAGLAGR
jgi:uncharacterized BrkB/YihY/UPF0761 family membrane protein